MLTHGPPAWAVLPPQPKKGENSLSPGQTHLESSEAGAGERVPEKPIERVLQALTWL